MAGLPSLDHQRHQCRQLIATHALANVRESPHRILRTRPFCETQAKVLAPFTATRNPRTRTHSRQAPSRLPPPSVAETDVVAAMSATQTAVEACDALIVGAGPAGLGTALLLAQRKRWGRIIILERRPSLEAEGLDKSYVYMIDGRGRVLTDEAGVTAAVEAAGVVSTSMTLTVVSPDGNAKTKTFNAKDNSRSNVWLPRRSFLAALHGGLAEHEREGRVKLVQGVELTAVHLAHGPGTSGSAAPIVVRARDVATGREMAFAPRLLVGADGMKSEVRKSLAAWTSVAGLPADWFCPVVLDSPSAGLRYKVLRLPPNAPFRKPPSPPPASSNGGGDKGRSEAAGVLHNSQFGVVAGVKAPRNRAMRLGMLPLRDPAGDRTANVIAPADHAVWSMTRGSQLSGFLQESFPQLDIPALLDEQQLAAAAEARGGVFPRPQYLRHFTAVLQPPAEQAAAAEGAKPQTGGEDSAAATACGVALVGDAVHCFPPDLGQGVNSAMSDVVGLMQALDEAGGGLPRALELYEARRAPEAAALVELMTFGGPFQYNQDQLGRALWSANIVLRTLLSKLAPWAFAPQTFVLVQRSELSYTQILEKVHATTRRIWVLAAALAAAALAAAVSMALRAGAAAAVASAGLPIGV